jgi:hypothetical protein
MSEPTTPPERSNTLGKMSLILGIISLILLFFVGSCVNIFKDRGGNVDSVKPLVQLFGGTFALIAIIATGLGIGGLFGRNRPKATAVMGLFFGAVSLAFASAIASMIK